MLTKPHDDAKAHPRVGKSRGEHVLEKFDELASNSGGQGLGKHQNGFETCLRHTHIVNLWLGEKYRQPRKNLETAKHDAFLTEVVCLMYTHSALPTVNPKP